MDPGNTRRHRGQGGVDAALCRLGDIGPLAMSGMGAGATSVIPEAVRPSLDKTPIGRAVSALEQARKLLAEDIDGMNAGKPPIHFCTESLLEPVATPVAG